MTGIRQRFASVLFVVLAALSPQLFAAQPDWVGGDSAEYSSAQYLLGRGTGATEEEAQNRARGDLAAIFEVRIQVASENTISISQSDKKSQVNKLATQRVSAKTDKVLSGVSIAKIWRDPLTKDFHALAVLSRAQAAAALREELLKIDTAVQQQFDASKAATDPLLKIAALTQALAVSIKRDGFQASLQVVNPSGTSLDAPIPQVTIQSEINDTLKRVKIAPEVASDDGVKEFAGILKGGLAAAGFLASDTGSAELVLQGRLVLVDLGRQANWNWVRASVEVSLVEKASGRVRGSKTWPAKASAQDPVTARSRALIEVEKLFKQELRTTLIGFAAS